jgi:hypothetical protein
MPKGYGRPAPKTRRLLRKGAEDLERNYPKAVADTAKLRRMLAGQSDAGLEHRMTQAAVEREYLMSPSAIAGAARNLAERQAKLLRKRAEPTSSTSNMVKAGTPIYPGAPPPKQRKRKR